ncbi:hypothetical protein [Mesobacillus maritimus]|uniref:Lycopene cyclase domain-containing protein n=1 Tax=Mesobacillus maritimus TaxID=1643336 RepID=A0ABS7K152_9BACI|nr:hypothetical protein [Mesobacillus maritimus]MBY0095974.1 hypothetical protein [Mesobacillus maritimus]
MIEMKIWGSTLLILVFLIGLSFGIDLLIGFDLRTSLRNAFTPLAVMEPVEFVIFFSLIIIYIGKSMFEYILMKKQKKKQA